jgi:hypothetical protein
VQISRIKRLSWSFNNQFKTGIHRHEVLEVSFFPTISYSWIQYDKGRCQSFPADSDQISLTYQDTSIIATPYPASNSEWFLFWSRNVQISHWLWFKSSHLSGHHSRSSESIWSLRGIPKQAGSDIDMSFSHPRSEKTSPAIQLEYSASACVRNLNLLRQSAREISNPVNLSSQIPIIGLTSPESMIRAPSATDQESPFLPNFLTAESRSITRIQSHCTVYVTERQFLISIAESRLRTTEGSTDWYFALNDITFQIVYTHKLSNSLHDVWIFPLLLWLLS